MYDPVMEERCGERRLEALEDRLARLEAERAILDVIHRYGHMIDYGDRAGWLDLFGAHAVLDVRLPRENAPAWRMHGDGEAHADGVRYAGRAALESFIATHSSAPAAWHKHFVVDARISLTDDGGTATAASYFARIDARDGVRTITALGRYRDRLVRCEDERWRFVERVAEVESLG
jgi:3-phenylpropionate/cinnamic acid dioxygenase small subunit